MNLWHSSIPISHHSPYPSPSPTPNNRRSAATQSVHSFSWPTRPHRPGFSRVLTMIRLVKRNTYSNNLNIMNSQNSPYFLFIVLVWRKLVPTLIFCIFHKTNFLLSEEQRRLRRNKHDVFSFVYFRTCKNIAFERGKWGVQHTKPLWGRPGGQTEELCKCTPSKLD